MVYDASYGIIPVHMDHGRRKYLLVQHGKGHWGFPKGHAEQRETHIETARRELMEEAGVEDVQVIDEPAFKENYFFKDKAGQLVRKTVTYYVGYVGDPTVKPCPKEVQGIEWGTYKQTRDRLTFKEGRRVLDEAEAFLAAHRRPR